MIWVLEREEGKSAWKEGGTTQKCAHLVGSQRALRLSERRGKGAYFCGKKKCHRAMEV